MPSATVRTVLRSTPFLRALGAFAALACIPFRSPAKDTTANPAVAQVLPSAPPHLPDAEHVTNGCHLSTLSYLARFATAYPHESGQPLVVMMRNADGELRSHTVAVITWAGERWCRDEYFGVFPLHQRTDSKISPEAQQRRVSTLLERKAQRNASPTRTVKAANDRAMAVAAQMLPCPSRTFVLQTSGGEVAALLFRPHQSQIAVYIPRHGTCLAECNVADDTEAVALFARTLGYKVNSITSAQSQSATLYASN